MSGSDSQTIRPGAPTSYGLELAGPSLATGTSYRETTGAPFALAIRWWADSNKQILLMDKIITRDSAQKPSRIVSKVYDSSGIRVRITITDDITYSGPFETDRARSVVIT